MPLLKRRHSCTRRDKRRGQDKIKIPALVKCAKTQVIHIPHRAYIYQNDLYYNGRLIIKGFKK